jgi:HK97 family phage portal protein
MTDILAPIRSLLSRASMENPATSLSNPDNWLYDALGSSQTTTGLRVSSTTALTLDTVFRAVSMISRDVGKLPMFIYKRDGEGKTRDPTRPAYNLLRYDATPYMTAMTLRQVLQAHALLLGNGYAYIDRDGGAAPVGLILCDPSAVQVTKVGGRILYTIWAGGKAEVVDGMNVLHIKGLGFDGLTGYSVISKAAESLGGGLAMREYGSRFFGNNAEPRVVLEHPNTFGSDDIAKRFKDSWNAMHGGLSNAHKTAVLEEGIKAHVISISARDSQLIEGRKFHIREVANWFGIPPHKLGDDAKTSYNSLEQENQAYLDDALDGWLCTWASEEEKRADSHIIEFLRAALLRSNMADRANYESKALAGMPWMTINQVRGIENMNPLDDPKADELQIPINLKQGATPPDETPAPAAKPKAAPMDEPMDEEEEPPADTAPGRAITIRTHLERALADAESRMLTRLTTAARRAAHKPDTFGKWLGGFASEHEAVIRAALDPNARALAVLDGRDADDALARTVALCGKVRAAAQAVYDKSPGSTFAAALDAAMTQLEGGTRT